MSRYATVPLGAPRVARQWIPAGLPGTRRTAAHVARLIREGARDFYVRQKAIDILLASRVPAKDYVGEVNALFRWVQRHVRYTKDPFRIEVLHSARRLLELRAGDCDDMTILLGALIKAVGHPVRLVLTGPEATRPDLFSHIYLEARPRGRWIPLDATMPVDMGWAPRTPVRMVLSIEQESNHGDTRTATAAGATLADADTPRDATADARVAPRLAARHPQRRLAAARLARESAVGSPEGATAADARSLGVVDAAPHLEDGAPARVTSTHDATPDRRVARVEPPALDARRRDADADAHARSRPAASAVRAGRAAARHASASGDAASGACERGQAVAAGAALYRRVSQFPPRTLTRVHWPRVMPSVVVELGRLVAVVYRSDKWVGHPRTYIHRMDDPPRLVSDVHGRRLFVVGGSYRVTERGIEG